MVRPVTGRQPTSQAGTTSAGKTSAGGLAVAHPYIPNSAPASRTAMLAEIGVDSVEALYESIPAELRVRGQLELPSAIRDELGLRRHVEALLARNTSTSDVLSFLGGGCWPHFVPAVVDEIAGRAEFLTSYGGGPYTDHGKYQAIFEFQSLIGELVGMDVVSTPTYDWVTAATSALMMAVRITGRRTVIVPATVNPEFQAYLRMFARPWADVVIAPVDWSSGLVELSALSKLLAERADVAAVYVENPTFLGFVEEGAADIATIAHGSGALAVVGIDASTLGVLAAPADYGADIVCGDVQALGAHMLYGGGQCGFIASRDEERFVRENPAILVSAVPTLDGTAWGFAWALLERTSYDLRGESRDYTGTSQWLWGITAAVHLSLLGPEGLRELGEGLMARSAYAIDRLGHVGGVRAPGVGRIPVKEFVVNFDGTGRSVAEINRRLLERRVFGGRDLSVDFPWLGQSALYCVTEVHSKTDVDRLVYELEALVS